MNSRLDEFTVLLGLTVSEIAERAGCSRMTVVRARKDGPEGIGSLTIGTLDRIAKAMGIRATDLVECAHYSTARRNSLTTHRTRDRTHGRRREP